MIYVAIVEDDDDIREALALLISGSPGLACTGVFRDCESAIERIGELMPDVLLLDIELPGMSGISAIPQLRGILPELDILMVTIHESDAMIFEALCAGASGYLVKTTSPGKLLKSIEEIHNGGAPMSAPIARRVIRSFRKNASRANDPLTRRETEILSQLCKGESYKMIADSLCISRGTVHTHIKKIYKKLHVSSNAQAVAKAIREKLV